MRFLRDNGLTIILLGLFGFSLAGQWLAGWRFQIEQLDEHGQPPVSLIAFARDPLFLSSVFENWESEFLQMSAYVVLTALLVQRGSAESRDPDAPPRDAHLVVQARKKDAPAILRAGAILRWLYARSLGLALFLLFCSSFALHWMYSARAAADDAVQHGAIPQSFMAYLGSAQLWFESFQNWQSEFLSTAVLILLSIYLRQRESPESKPVAAPHRQTGS